LLFEEECLCIRYLLRQINDATLLEAILAAAFHIAFEEFTRFQSVLGLEF